MASSILKKPCSKCNKGMGIVTCNGCEQSYCIKHIIDHRKELSIQMDNIGQEYDLLRRDLMQDDNGLYPLLHRIDLWEQESIRKIRQAAKQVRNDLHECLDRNKNQLKNVFNKLADELQLNQQSENYTEIDFQLWTQQLTELRKALEKTQMLQIAHNDPNLPPIYMIKIREQNGVRLSDLPVQVSLIQPSNTLLTEKFNVFIGDAIFSENSLVATHSGDPRRSTMIYITKLYASEIHQIRFRIERIHKKYLFFGIINSLEQMNRMIFHSPSLYGWMAPDIRVVKSRKLLTTNINDKFNENDEILLTLNFNIQQILFEHPRTNTMSRIPIDLRLCPVPWRVVVAFFNRNDSVRILP